MELEMKKRAALAVLCLLLGTASASAMNLGFSVGLGISYPTQRIVRDIYGTGFPFGARVWGGNGSFLVSTGIDYLSNRGQALAPNGESDVYPLTLTVTSIPIAIYFLSDRGKFFYAFGGGAYYSRYQEKWEDLDIVATGRKWSWLAEFMGGYDLDEKISLFGSFGYVPMHTGRGSLVAYNIQLGGFRLTAGILLLLK
jgi:hypothetical protein